MPHALISNCYPAVQFTSTALVIWIPISLHQVKGSQKEHTGVQSSLPPPIPVNVSLALVSL